MTYKLIIAESAEKQLGKLDKYQERLIINWLRRHIDGSFNPRAHGKALSYDLAGYWRYRIGDYRAICKIDDDILTVVAVQIGHRSKVYF